MHRMDNNMTEQTEQLKSNIVLGANLLTFLGELILINTAKENRNDQLFYLTMGIGVGITALAAYKYRTSVNEHVSRAFYKKEISEVSLTTETTYEKSCGMGLATVALGIGGLVTILQ